MCFYHNNWSDPKIAQRDLVCYKIFFENDGELKSLFRDYIYTLNHLYEVKLGQKQKVNRILVFNILGEEIKGSLFCINEGLHSFQENYYKELRIMRELGLLSCFTVPANVNIYKCIIPKGSEYYKNQGGEYVSNKLIVKEKVF